MNVVNIEEKLQLVKEYWSPKIVGNLNNQQVKLVKLKGEFVWHHHDNEDELFYVLSGVLTMEFRNKIEIIRENEFIIVPRGVEHKPVANEEVSIMLFEPATTINTGNTINAFTKNTLESI
jgi:mannose-6-phosphate isomerase-like protein (cupin superfamily)